MMLYESVLQSIVDVASLHIEIEENLLLRMGLPSIQYGPA